MVEVVRVQLWSKAKALELLERVTRMLRWKGEGKWWGGMVDCGEAGDEGVGG